MLNQYEIEGTEYLMPPEAYFSEDTYKNFKNGLLDFKSTLSKNLEEEKNVTYCRFGDGDFYFLNKIPRGSAKPGRRALKRPYFLINHKKFVQGSTKNDYYLSLMSKSHRENFENYFNKPPDYLIEYVYGLLSNKWILQSTVKNIGLVGADKKLELINSLMEKQEYREYLGIEKFSDYISIPQRFAADNLSKTKRLVKKQLTKANSNLFLVGIGHVKTGLLHEFKNYNRSVYLDIGVGMDALAGVVNLTRPYFGNWKNYQLKNFSLYKEIDFLVNKNNHVKNIHYL
tara:strand:- start:603 stop:1457 length:855 start_codon:yes stop_codon:yes gene_type:complete